MLRFGDLKHAKRERIESNEHARNIRLRSVGKSSRNGRQSLPGGFRTRTVAPYQGTQLANNWASGNGECTTKAFKGIRTSGYSPLQTAELEHTPIRPFQDCLVFMLLHPRTTSVRLGNCKLDWGYWPSLPHLPVQNGCTGSCTILVSYPVVSGPVLAVRPWLYQSTQGL